MGLMRRRGDQYDNNGERIDDMRTYAVVVSIQHKILCRYINPNIGKREELGDESRGRTKLLTDSDVKFIGEVCAQADQGNDGPSRKKAIDNIQELILTLTRESASRQLTRRILPENDNAGIVKSMHKKDSSHHK